MESTLAGPAKGNKNPEFWRRQQNPQASHIAQDGGVVRWPFMLR
jgi:hypothetical protein